MQIFKVFPSLLKKEYFFFTSLFTRKTCKNKTQMSTESLKETVGLLIELIGDLNYSDENVSEYLLRYGICPHCYYFTSYCDQYKCDHCGRCTDHPACDCEQRPSTVTNSPPLSSSSSSSSSEKE